MRSRVLLAAALLSAASWSAAAWRASTPFDTPPPAPSPTWLTTTELPGFRFQLRIGGTRLGAKESACITQTLCVSGAIPGRSEVFVRVVGPKPNGFLWPTIVKFTTSRVEVWIEQLATSQLRYYDLPAADPDAGVLAGRFDRTGFVPAGAAAAWAAWDDQSLVRSAAWPGAAGTAITSGIGPPPPGSAWLTTAAVPGFQFQMRIGGSRLGAGESACISETLCVSGAVPGRAEVFARVVGPKPNGNLWPTIVKFTTSRVEVWVRQTASGELQYYDLPAVDPDGGDLAGLFDRIGFRPPGSPPVLDASYFTPLAGAWHFTHGLVVVTTGHDGAFTIAEQRMNGQVFQRMWLASQTAGLVELKEQIWVDPGNYLSSGYESTGGFVSSLHLWDPAFVVFPYGLAVGESRTIVKDEEVTVPLGHDGVTGGCAVTPWTDWKFIHQTATVTVEAREVVTVPAGSFTALRVKLRQLETNNPFNACGETSDHTQHWWFAKGVGFVKLDLDGEVFELTSFSVGG